MVWLCPVSMRVLSTDEAMPADISIGRDLADTAAASLHCNRSLPFYSLTPSPLYLQYLPTLSLHFPNTVFFLSTVNTFQYILSARFPTCNLRKQQKLSTYLTTQISHS